MADETLLVVTGAAITPYAARGINQTLSPIQASSYMRRTVNGTLTDLSDSALQKYRSTLTCDDMDVPAWDGVYPGQTVTVDCVCELAYVTSGGSASRSVVSGSSRTSGAYTFYRPQLTMMVTAYSVSTNEWGATVGWQMELEEV